MAVIFTLGAIVYGVVSVRALARDRVILSTAAAVLCAVFGVIAGIAWGLS